MAEEMEQGAYTGVIHCFTASEDFAHKALDLGLIYLDFGHCDLQECQGLAGHRRQATKRKTAGRNRRTVSFHRYLIEEKPGSRPFVADTARFLADLRGEEYDDLCQSTATKFLQIVQQGDALKLTILGCGTSAGVPRVGNDWGDCDPEEPKNRRSRVSILVKSEATRILVDTSPDLRNQLLDNDIHMVDAVSLDA